MFQAKINNNEFPLEVLSKNKFKFGDKVIDLDIAKISETKLHVIYQNKSFNVELVHLDKEKKNVSLKVNNSSYEVTIKDKFDLLLSQLGMSNLTTKQIKDLKAPMPGLVIDILVQAGEAVKEGDTLLILEAMKMENVLKSPINGIVKSVQVNKTNTVDKNQVLISFE